MKLAKEKYYAHGKLLISGEYAVLNGALAFALPTRQGQWIIVEREYEQGELFWTASDINGRWFSCVMLLPSLEVKITSDHIKSERLKRVLQAAKEINPQFLSTEEGIRVDSYLEFYHLWGLGSSSSLIANIADWAQVDSFTLFRKVSMGSGYDLACSIHGKPLLYQICNDKPKSEPVIFLPTYHKNIHFVYLGLKQDTDQSLDELKDRILRIESMNDVFSKLTHKFLHANSLHQFSSYMDEHERLIAENMNLHPVKERLFPDFKGHIKSLGAWGGDFIMVASKESAELVRNYFVNKGFNIIFSFNDIILTSSDESIAK